MRRATIHPKAAAALAGLLAVVIVAAIVVTDALPRAAEESLRSAPAPGERAGADDATNEPRRGSGSRAEPRRADRAGGRRELRPAAERTRWRDSVAIGLPHAGRLVRGVRLPTEDETYFTWDPIEKRSPSRQWRRWGTDKLVRTILGVMREFRRDNPGAPRIAVGDLSRPEGGDFGPRWGGIGHASHQNGLDVDIYYPLRNGKERAPLKVSEIDMGLAQDLVDRFVEAGAVKVFVGPSTPLTGPPEVVQKLVHHDNHLHARLE